MCHTEMDDTGITATSHGSGVEKMVQHEYHSAMSWEESTTPGPRASFMPREQPLMKGREWATDEQPTQGTARHPKNSNNWATDERPVQGAKRHAGESWLIEAMAKMESCPQAPMQTGLASIAHNVGELEV